MSETDVDLERATESTWAKAVTRFVVPLLLALLGTVCGLLLQDIRESLVALKSKQDAQASDVQQVNGEMKVLNAKLDNGVIWRITELERRLNTVEQAQKTP
ncbi:hypothetical protein NB688_000578 [Xanthomonas sacchari]|uniref:Uncharacterized protein n=1 Tax=Xanthomonas sacchari TaxID=56458 RepID=A0ABT3DUV0_9XANT|nr:hypothetical protein [Xanthomonas sacchari]MCW0398764.1 hypothetical protein [Xanthomonas sacchari]MCW0418412.1 hypothetical protein [Xanthomonas sacchari]UYK72525.1 hypothetical protein NG828_20450 [Xanthomonas sacchari]